MNMIDINQNEKLNLSQMSLFFLLYSQSIRFFSSCTKIPFKKLNLKKKDFSVSTVLPRFTETILIMKMMRLSGITFTRPSGFRGDEMMKR